jgi:hypothetical protein
MKASVKINRELCRDLNQVGPLSKIQTCIVTITLTFSVYEENTAPMVIKCEQVSFPVDLIDNGGPTY